MKWLIIQSAGQHDGSDGWTPNNYLREGLSIQRAAIKNGFECEIWGKRHINFATTPDFNSYDIIFLIENYEWEWIPDLSQYKKPLKLHWIIDLHCQNPYVKWSNMCDIVLHSTKSLMSSYKNLCPRTKHVWFPNAIDDDYFYARNKDKTENIAFVGSLQNRADFLQKLSIKQYFLTGIDMIDKISSLKIHFNKSISCDVNYRCFETLGLETCLLTNNIEEMSELGFIDNKNCLLYHNLQDCKEKISFALQTNIWKEIAKEGYILSKKHTYTNRIKELLCCIM